MEPRKYQFNNSTLTIVFGNIWRSSRFIWLLLCIIISPHVQGQVLDDSLVNKLVVRADPVVQVGKNFRIGFLYTSRDSLAGILPPQWNWDHPHHELLYGPSKSTQTSYAFRNGKQSVLYGMMYSYYIKFTRPGSFTIPSMTTKSTTGETLTSQPFTVRVTTETVQPTQAAPSTSDAPKAENLFVVEAKVNKTDISLGDCFDCEIRLYTNMNVTQMTPFSVLPVSNAYWREHDLPEQKKVETTEYNGASVKSVLWAKYSIIPLQSGTIRIDPMIFTAWYLTPKPDADPFEAFFNGGNNYINHDTIVQTNPIEIHVADKQMPTRDAKPNISEQPHGIGLVIDRSSSLFARNDTLSESFLELETLFVKLVQSNLPSDHSVTLFAKKPHYPTRTELDNLSDVSPSAGNDGSAIYDAILASALREGALTSRHPPFSVLLLTDGSDNASHLSESTLINILLQNKIRVDVIAFASKKDSLFYPLGKDLGFIKMDNTQNMEDVKRIAQATNGFFIWIDNKKQIPAAIRQVRESLRNAPTPDLSPEKTFAPNINLLYKLYDGIISDAETDF